MYKILFQLLPLMREVLKKSDLLIESILHPSKTILLWRDLNNYKKVWEIHYKKKSFHFRLKDQSLFRFLYLEKKITFEYLNCPYFFEEVPLVIYDEDLTLESEDYEERPPTPIRYDYEPQNFNKISHPIGHIHLGLENSIRIGTCCVFNPLTFLLFCLRQIYPSSWKKILENNNFEKYQKHIREEISLISKEYKKAFKREHFIT